MTQIRQKKQPLGKSPGNFKQDLQPTQNRFPISTYQDAKPFFASLRGQQVQFYSKPGLPEYNQVMPSSILLAELTQLESQQEFLWLGCGHGAALCALGQAYRNSNFWAADQNIIALQMTERSIEANALKNIRLLPEADNLNWAKERYDSAVIDLPKGRKLTQRWLMQAFTGLKTGGRLFLAGANDLGIQSASKDAEELFGPSAVLGYKKGNRVLRFVKEQPGTPEPPWVREPGMAPGSWIEFEVQTPAGALSLRSLPGVFSAGGLDDGTAMLLQNLEVPLNGAVLDPGCGCGVIGICASLSGASQVDFLDANLLAVASTQENITSLGFAEKGISCQVFTSDLLQAVVDRQYDLIAANPPFHSGKETNYLIVKAFIEQSLQHLKPGGRLVLVANLFLRYERLLQEHFGNAQTLASDGKFHVLQARKQNKTAKRIQEINMA